MRKVFQLMIALSGSIMLCQLMLSCNQSNFVGPGLYHGPIKITGYSTSGSTLTLDDNGHDAQWEKVARKENIKWMVDQSTVPKIHIVGIAPDPKYSGSNDPNFFYVQPHSQGNHWEAVISDLSPDKGFLEKYYIQWKKDGDDSTYTFDPLMQIYPTSPLTKR